MASIPPTQTHLLPVHHTFPSRKHGSLSEQQMRSQIPEERVAMKHKHDFQAQARTNDSGQGRQASSPFRKADKGTEP